jgi:sulfur transfer protein SufE
MPSAQHFDEWLLEMAREVAPAQSMQLRKPENFIRGCEVATWIAGYNTENGWHFDYDSDSKINRSLAEIVTSVCNGLDTQKLQSIKFSDFTGITTFLPSNRKKGIQLMLNRIHNITH